jgi:hypothetical protein
MDTDDLSKATYDGIISEAEEFNPDLSLPFGVLADQCKNDDDFLNKAERLINKWLKVKDCDLIIDDIFFGEPVDYDDFKITLKKILSNITEIRKTPMKEREYEDWG